MSLFSVLESENIYAEESWNPKAQAILRCGDSFEEFKNIPDDSIQLVVSSPPYNLGKVYEKKTALTEYLNEYRKLIVELFRICRSSGHVAWQVGNFVDKGEVFPLDVYFYPLFIEAGFKLRNRIVWRFGHGLHASKRFSGRYETVLWFTKSDSYTFNLDSVRIPSKYPGKRHYKGEKIGLPSGNPLGKNPSDFWEFVENEWNEGVIEIPNVKSNHPEKTIHPCQFPIELVERFVLALTDENDWVLDPFGGVGTTLIAAIKNKRRGFSIEKESQYVELTRERIKAYNEGSLKYRALGTPIHQPSGHEKVAQIPEEWTKTQRGLL